MEIKGQQFGVRLDARGHEDPHVIIQLLGEDDENWFTIGNGFSSFWLDDLILVLQDTRAILMSNTQRFERESYGYRFKERT